MNSTDPIDNGGSIMPAMHFCRAGIAGKEKAPLEGRAEPKGDRQSLSGGNAAEQGREEKTPL